jgi:hypothetical protein
MEKHSASRRKFAKKLAYIAPAILTLKAAPSFAATGSSRNENSRGDYQDRNNNRRRSYRGRDND